MSNPLLILKSFKNVSSLSFSVTEPGKNVWGRCSFVYCLNIFTTYIINLSLIKFSPTRFVQNITSIFCTRRKVAYKQALVTSCPFIVNTFGDCNKNFSKIKYLMPPWVLRPCPPRSNKLRCLRFILK